MAVVLQFKIELLDTSPVVWRRIQVPADYSFWDLHVAIQDAMGWTDSHLHDFTLEDQRGEASRSGSLIPRKRSSLFRDGSANSRGTSNTLVTI